jgi:PAS domain S-box-containing protein
LNAQLGETQQFAALVELSDDFIAIAGLDGGIVYVNPGGRRLVGLHSLEEARARTIADFLPPGDEVQAQADRISLVKQGGAWQGESSLRHFETGEVIPVSVNSFRVMHPVTGDPLAIATVQRDLRERRRTEQQLRERADEVEQLAAARRFLLVEALRAEERMRRQIGDALHDDVLQELYAANQDLEEVQADDDALHRARVSVTAAGRQLREAVRDLHPAVSWTGDLQGRLQSIVAQGEERAGFKAELEYGLATPSDADDLVLALVRELVQNVVKHAQAAHVGVRVVDHDESLAIEVADDGIGMEAERPRQALRSGHVGLASARERVEALGGRFEIASEPGGGTRVQVVVPRAGLSGLAADRRLLG